MNKWSYTSTPTCLCSANRNNLNSVTTQSVAIIKNKRLILLKKIIAVYFQEVMKYINTLCGQNAALQCHMVYIPTIVVYTVNRQNYTQFHECLSKPKWELTAVMITNATLKACLESCEKRLLAAACLSVYLSVHLRETTRLPQDGFT
jgi:hypothetical protein